jgi:hypothetical protein
MQALPRPIQSIVEEQVRIWERRSRAEREAPRAWPVVTVSRQYGAQGAILAGEIASRLGFRLWDREVLWEIAQHSEAEEMLFATLDEHRRGALTKIFSEMRSGPHVSEGGYRLGLLRVVHAISEHGSAVIIGRGAQFILKPEAALRVRVVCPFEQRVQWVAERKGISKVEARKDVEKVEQERRGFIRDLFWRDDEEAIWYDLVVNTVTLEPPQAAEVVLAAYRARFGALPPGATP